MALLWILFVLLFTYALGGVVHPPGIDHSIDCLLPGAFVIAIGFGASPTGVAMAEHVATGMIDRSRSLPMASSAVLVGRVAADVMRDLFVVVLMIDVASVIGFRFHAGPAAALGAITFAAGVGLAFSALNTWLGLLVRDPGSASLAGLFPFIILMFTSSTLVPVATMPGWLSGLRNGQPRRRLGRRLARPVPRGADADPGPPGVRVDRRGAGDPRASHGHPLSPHHRNLNELARTSDDACAKVIYRLSSMLDGYRPSLSRGVGIVVPLPERPVSDPAPPSPGHR